MPYNIDQPEKYVCSVCGAKGVKLWRQYNTCVCFLELKCATCIVPDKTVDEHGKIEDKIVGMSDQVGGLVPAIPTADGSESFWGYTSVPILGVVWWKALPTYIGQKFDYKKIIIDRIDWLLSSSGKEFLVELTKKIFTIENLTDNNLKEQKEMFLKHDDYFIKLFSVDLIDLILELDYDERIKVLVK